MRRAPLFALLALVVALVVTMAPAALAEDAGNHSEMQERHSTRPVPLFDNLHPYEDVVYLITNSSFVWGPDPHGLSEEITFTGFVNVPKWPLKGYERRTLSDGRQQIDIELSHSDLIGYSYLLGGEILLGEHPDLRSLGTITEAVPGAFNVSTGPRSPGVEQASNVARHITLAATTANSAQWQARSFKVSRDFARVLEQNADLLWSDLVADELRKLESQLPAAELRRSFPATTLFDPVDVELQLPPDLVDRLEGSGVNVNSIVVSVMESIAKDLDLPNQNVMTLVVPSDFIVARKVLLRTAKGILYNETAVPVRGKLDTIPPVRDTEDRVGLNVFRGMELPIPLLDEGKNVDGWFYSKVHLAMSVRPDAVEKEMVEATFNLRAGERSETLTLRGPVEIHHGETRIDGNGRRETDIEVVVMALRGHSELLGQDIMIAEAFSDRERFSRGTITWQDGSPLPSNLSLFVDLLTPAGKLMNDDPIQMAGVIGEFESAGKLEKGNLSIPMVKAGGTKPFAAHEGVVLFNEAERPVATIDSVVFRFVQADQVADSGSETVDTTAGAR